jgi:hypothetical protein
MFNKLVVITPKYSIALSLQSRGIFAIDLESNFNILRTLNSGFLNHITYFSFKGNLSSWFKNHAIKHLLGTPFKSYPKFLTEDEILYLKLSTQTECVIIVENLIRQNIYRKFGFQCYTYFETVGNLYCILPFERFITEGSVQESFKKEVIKAGYKYIPWRKINVDN